MLPFTAADDVCREVSRSYGNQTHVCLNASISTIPVIILGDLNIHFNDEHKSSKLRNMLNDYQMQST